MSSVKFWPLAAGALLFALGGCAELTTYSHETDLKPSQAHEAFIDAKQRVVFTIPGSVTDINNKQTAVLRICAEPSPDALSAIAATTNGSISDDKVRAQLATALSETSSNIGLRTQSIQLMRDAMYRLCEGAASGELSSTQFEMLQRRFQNSMVAILAIEQLTGAVRPASAQLSSSANFGSAKDIASLTESTINAREASSAAAAIATKKAEAVTAAEAAVTAYLADKGGTEDGLTDTQKKELEPLKTKVSIAKSEQASADTDAANLKDKLDIYMVGMKAIGGGDMATSATATSSGGSGSSVSDTSATAIATAVSSM